MTQWEKATFLIFNPPYYKGYSKLLIRFILGALGLKNGLNDPSNIYQLFVDKKVVNHGREMLEVNEVHDDDEGWVEENETNYLWEDQCM